MGWSQGLLRRECKAYDASRFSRNVGSGDDPFTDYDRQVCADAIEWLESKDSTRRDKP